MPSADEVTQPGFYRWEISGRPIAVKLSLQFVDRLLQEVMRGFGSMPRRGVEMGGILLGSVDRSGDKPVVMVEDFEPVPCQHSRGATFQLSPEELARFEELAAKWAPAEGKQSYALGYYRSHTREGLGLSDEDLEIFSAHFPAPEAICLLIKPFATRVSQAGIFIRENGNIRAQSSYQEFPFRRREMGGGDNPVQAPRGPRDPRGAGEFRSTSSRERMAHTLEQPSAPPPPPPPPPPPASHSEQPYRSTFADMASIATNVPPPTASAQEPDLTDEKKETKTRRGWVWIPLSFIFLLLGTVLGFQLALSLRNKLPESIRPDPYSLHMTVSPAGDSLHVKWDRDAAPLHSQAKGSLIISDGGAQKVVQLDGDQLKNGSVVYRRASNDVRFRLEVYTADRVTVSETMDFRIESPAK